MVTKVIADPNLLDVIDKVHGFYNDAWNQLTGQLAWTVAITLFVLGVIVPLIISWYQRRFYKIEEGKIKQDLTNEVSRLLDLKFDERVKQIETKVSENFEEHSAKWDKKFAQSQGMIFHSQARFEVNIKAYDDAARSSFTCLNWYSKSEDALNFRSACDGLLMTLKNLNKNSIEDLEKQNFKFDDFMEKIDKKYPDGRFSDLVIKIKKELDIARKR